MKSVTISLKSERRYLGLRARNLSHFLEELGVGKRRDYSLDFKEEKASFGRYGIHDYPAMFHYLVIRKLLNKFGDGKKILYDPFCGSGVALCEAIRKGMTAYGTDINPLALLIAKVRCASNVGVIPIEKIIREAETATPHIPRIKNCNYWFKDYVVQDLGKLRTTIENYKCKEYYDLLLVAFSQTVREVSNNRKDEFKRFRMSKEELDKFNPNVFETFKKNLVNYLERLKRDRIKAGKVFLYRADIRKKLPFSENVDIVITSPPYGDSKTTVAYGQFFSFSFEWLAGLNPFGDSDLRLDMESLGGRKNHFDLSFSETLKEVYQKIYQINPVRANEVAYFYADLFAACKNICSVLNEQSIVCFVVGNRTVSKIQIPMDEIVKEIFEFLGLAHVETLIREISRKRMPLQNSPTNKSGEKSPTMKYEYIVVMSK